MSKYVMSDLHGCCDKFMKMLELISFTDQDELYILGDMFDRGTNPLGILDYVIDHKNIILLKGNHEKFFQDYIETGNSCLWYYNGGYTTHEQIIQRGEEYQNALYKYIKNLPCYKVVDNNLLAHASVYLPKNYQDLTIKEILNLQEEDICLWDRSNIDSERAIEGYNIIVGHTPTFTIDKGISSIIKKNGTIYVDCGCVFEKYNGRLACLRLNDMNEFYV